MHFHDSVFDITMMSNVDMSGQDIQTEMHLLKPDFLIVFTPTNVVWNVAMP